jgi:hypothetical protein
VIAPRLLPVADAAATSSGFGLVIFLLLVAAVIFLFRSMNKQLRRVPPTFDERLPEPADPADDAVAAARGEAPRADQAVDQGIERPDDRPRGES